MPSTASVGTASNIAADDTGSGFNYCQFMEPLTLLQTVQASAQAVIDQTGPDAHGSPTPCEGWDVAMLLDKMVTSASLFAVLCRGEKPGPELNLLFPTEVGRTDPSGAFAAASQDCLLSFSDSELEGEMMGPLGVLVPKKAGLLVRSLDCTINTWDLARSIGVEPGVGSAVPVALIDFASGFLPKVREKNDHPRFGEPTEFEGVDELDQLVALSGRDPNWQP